VKFEPPRPKWPYHNAVNAKDMDIPKHIATIVSGV
jgi:hypothetical protein